MKKRYHGVFNWHGEYHELYTMSKNRWNARLNLLTRLAKKLRISLYLLLNYYTTGTNYLIREIK